MRTPQEFAQGHIAGAVNLPLGEVAARAGEVPGSVPSTSSAAAAAAAPRPAGFSRPVART
ncbi:rhodanese-like domain-containing protein [Deinococcus wulumuqiensis]|uniref:rhodanese-like domain-containing protein n=1 Tax=Deinococcus wulumuqiensis TaxID=980427 RepID=UPI00384E9FAC